jgi:hypothetical protein
MALITAEEGLGKVVEETGRGSGRRGGVGAAAPRTRMKGISFLTGALKWINGPHPTLRCMMARFMRRLPDRSAE